MNIDISTILGILNAIMGILKSLFAAKEDSQDKVI